MRWFYTEYSAQAPPYLAPTDVYGQKCYSSYDNQKQVLTLVASPVLMPLNVGGQSVALNRMLIERLYGAYPPNYLTSIDSLYLKV